MSPSGLDMGEGQLMRSPTINGPKPCHLQAIDPCNSVVQCAVAGSLGLEAGMAVLFLWQSLC